MINVKAYKWSDKSRTLLRNVVSGDIFCFELDGAYRFGRIISRNKLGHVAEIFEHIDSVPDVSALTSLKRVGRPVILDSYGLFDRKIEGDWRIIGHQEGYAPSQDENIYFTLGVKGSCKKVDIFDNEEPISEQEAKKLPDYSPLGESDIVEELHL
ncbi:MULTISPECIES: Imm26 family immunity protein [unclassified Pseudomonas]|uniref:Imm26 family immunity protein n=1 Tax=unclassified Pseudomonas TaxID=196821 RepID=UPI0015A47EC1|nr:MULTISPECIES: Imm26 family immunity protein [unclassified Pseudomonas]NWC93002.1 phosphotriesterase [Pseudomonas sp. IPO3779]NWD19420.1 phosphotriesterase [Pseudomonas sp. IPO3778]